MKSPFCLRAFLAAFLFMCSCLPCGARSDDPPAPSNIPAARPSQEAPPLSPASITIPGPLRSFLRMAAISQEVSPEEVLPLLARNVVVEGYDWRGKTPQPTEYMILLKGYLRHARELMALAGAEGVIRVPNCGQAQPLLTILGYRLRQPCGPDTEVETAGAKKAFLTIDSGFPLTDLEDTLRGGKPFSYAFRSSRVPVLARASDWIAYEKERRKDTQGQKISKRKDDDDVIDCLVDDPALARLYWALARMDATTRAYLVQSPGLKKLVSLAPVLDFYGSHIDVQSGRVDVPGGVAAEPAWKSLVGASPESPAAFITRLVTKDEGWLAAYYAALARVSDTQQAYFTEPHRLRLFYRALRGQNIYPSPAKPVFRPNPGLVLLVTRLQLEPNGRPHIPGNLEVWEEILGGTRKSHSKIIRLWAKRASGWNNPDQLVAAMFALSRVSSETGPLQLYLVLSEMDRERPAKQRLKPQTVRLLAESYPRFGDQYLTFSEFHTLNNASITRFLSVAEDVDRIRDRILRADAVGIFQADVGLWQILARQGQIPSADLNHSWQQVINPFTNIRSSAQLFDAARGSLRALGSAAGKPQFSQEKIIDLLAGPDQTSPQGQQVKEELAYKIRSVLDAQRLVSLDTLLALGNELNQMARGKPMPGNFIRLAGQLREFQMPKPLFTPGERAEWTYGLNSNPHLQMELTTDLTKVLKSPVSQKRLTAARGQLVPFLRDSLVGLNYAYYEPPGAQMLLNNPLFVRSHDFSGAMTMGEDQTWQTPSVVGRGWAAAGGAHLAGSLAGLPYVLAEVEQDFIVPENVQALIWGDLVPSLLTSSVLPRWWRVTPNELHAVTLYLHFGQELIAAAGKNEKLRRRVMNILSNRMMPQKSEQVEGALLAGRPEDALSYLTPAETFYLAAQFRRSFPKEAGNSGGAGQELEKLAQRYPNEVSWERLSEDFGVPHPALAQTYSCELLSVKPFPTFMGYSSRLLAESWQSNNLYWASLADQMGYPPVMLNILVPQLTRRMVEKIFATTLEDRAALLRALRETGDEFRAGKIASLPKNKAGSGL